MTRISKDQLKKIQRAA